MPVRRLQPDRFRRAVSECRGSGISSAGPRARAGLSSPFRARVGARSPELLPCRRACRTGTGCRSPTRRGADGTRPRALVHTGRRMALHADRAIFVFVPTGTQNHDRLAARPTIRQEPAPRTSSPTMPDLPRPPSHLLTALRGHRRGQHSIRIDDQCRIRFRSTDRGAPQIEVSDHH